MHIFKPILAGADFPDRVAACLGAAAGIALTALVCLLASNLAHGLLFFVAPMGASAVLVFAVPASPLAQPWPVFGGNVISALIGVLVHHAVPDPALAAGIAVGGAILAMSLLRCLHPPGGAMALTAVIGGPAVAAAGYAFPLLPVAVNSAALLATAWCYHRLSRHSYPHRPPPLPTRALPSAAIDKALAEMGDSFDISREDLELLLERAELHARNPNASASKMVGPEGLEPPTKRL